MYLYLGKVFEFQPFLITRPPLKYTLQASTCSKNNVKTGFICDSRNKRNHIYIVIYEIF